MPSKEYHSKEYLQEEYIEKRRTSEEIAEECGVTGTTICDWLDRHNIDRRGQQEAQQTEKKSYHDQEWLQEQYVNKERSTHDIASECGVTGATILKYLRRYDIETRSTVDHLEEQRVEYQNRSDGYVQIRSRNPVGGHDSAKVHQLLAIANGANPYEVFSNGMYHCHHKNGVKWDNRPGNIELISAKEHGKRHSQQRAASTVEY